MALFNRKKTPETADMPPEVQDYYQAETREKTWMAWVLGLATLVVTILLALALFFGGRWVYRKVRNDNPAPVTTTQNENQPAESNGDSSKTNDNESAQPTPATPTPAPANSDTSSSAPANTPTTGDDLPNTGPADTLAIFVAVSILAYVAHRRFATN